MKERFKFLAIFMMMLVAASGFVSCSDDDDDNNVSNDSIIGTWKFNKGVVKEVKTDRAANDAIVEKDLLNVVEENVGNLEMTFSSDGYVVFDRDIAEISKYTYANNTLIIFDTDGEVEYNDTVQLSISNNVLKLDADYASEYNHLNLQEVIRLGIGNPTEFHVTKAIATLNYNRVQ